MSKAASFSRIQLYKKCPASYEWQYVLGNRDAYEPGAAARRGTRIHESIEGYFMGECTLDEEVPSKFVKMFSDIKDSECEIHPEYEFCMNKHWEPLGDFNHEDGYVRGYIDNVFLYPERLVLHEYKTGRKYDEHAEQKALYAMIAMILWPQYSQATVMGVYIDSGEVDPTHYSRASLSSMKFHWKREIDKLALPIYPARPGQHCRWCPKSKENGGTCQLG